MIKSGNVTVMVGDMEAAVRFYTEVLGLGTRGSLSIGLQVDSLEEAMEALEKKGVEFPGGITEDSAVRLAFFRDPDGNPLYLCQQKHW